MYTIGIIREGKTPPDKRVPFSPSQCVALQNQFNVRVLVQPSPIRCFTDEEYRAAGIALSEDPVSYTNRTLPTNREVVIWVVPVTIKQKRKVIRHR